MQEQPLYDAEQQRVPFHVIHGGKRYQVAHNFGPLKDELIAEYERRCDVRYSQAEKSEADGGKAVAQYNRKFAAAVWLWDKLAQSVEGYGSLEGVDWKGKIKDKYKASAIEDALLNCSVDEDEGIQDAEENEALPFDNEETITIRLRALFAGREVMTLHNMSEPSAEQMARFESLTSRSLIVKGRRLGGTETRIPSKARALGKLYDELCTSAEGYAGSVPLHHKMVIISHHLSSEQEALQGN